MANLKAINGPLKRGGNCPVNVGFPSLVDEEEFPMTMQVGMVGTDGVLIASDTRWTENILPIRSSFGATKFKINNECGVAVACSGSMKTASRLADEIISLSVKDANWRFAPIGSSPSAIHLIAERVLKAADPGRENAQCLIAFTRPNVELWLFELTKISGEWGPVCQAITTEKFAGDAQNPAVFWAERYYRKVPIECLIPLAAHLIFSAGILNSAGVDGLEMILCKTSGISYLSGEPISDLKLKSDELDKTIGESLISD